MHDEPKPSRTEFYIINRKIISSTYLFHIHIYFQSISVEPKPHALLLQS